MSSFRREDISSSEKGGPIKLMERGRLKRVTDEKGDGRGQPRRLFGAVRERICPLTSERSEKGRKVRETRNGKRVARPWGFGRRKRREAGVEDGSRGPVRKEVERRRRRT